MKNHFAKDMVSPYRQLFLQVREIVLSYEGVSEAQKQRITTYSDHNGGICHLRTTKNGVDIGYLKGAQIEDKFGCLHGKTKKMRVQSVTPSTLDEAAVRYYLEESMKLNRA